MTPAKNDLAYCKTLDRQECPALLPSQDIKTAIGVVKRAADDYSCHLRCDEVDVPRSTRRETLSA